MLRAACCRLCNERCACRADADACFDTNEVSHMSGNRVPARRSRSALECCAGHWWWPARPPGRALWQAAARPAAG